MHSSGIANKTKSDPEDSPAAKAGLALIFKVRLQCR